MNSYFIDQFLQLILACYIYAVIRARIYAYTRPSDKQPAKEEMCITIIHWDVRGRAQVHMECAVDHNVSVCGYALPQIQIVNHSLATFAKAVSSTQNIDSPQ